MVILMLLVLAVLVLTAVALVRHLSRTSKPAPPAVWGPGGVGPVGPGPTGVDQGGAAPPTAEQVLAERFARGEIDADEYRHRLDTLRAAGGSAGPGGPPTPTA
ncbi:SHOCT domain-containing protein [Kitasatospora sp. RG8]|uniref:SHOCT domain-containing protein n=1 Tax=Kitasatospora sp. RG8 TaxID=2820815 RepID=UPI001FD7BA3B|nr:SHOCT domain-containing protein [Kitasatospora sp. RG8]